MRGKAASLLLASLLASSVLSAQSTPAAALLVLSKSDRTLAIVDPSSMAVFARMPVGQDPHEVVASTDGRLAYVSNYGGGAYNTISVVDLVARKPLAPIDLGALRGPHGLVYAGGKVWFTAEAAKAIGSYDPASGRIDWVLGTGQNRTHMIFVFDDLKRLVSSNVNSASLSFAEKSAGGGRGAPGGPGGQGPPMGAPQGDWDITLVSVGRGAEGFDVSPDSRELWAANAQDGTISIVDVATKRVTRTLAANVGGANRLKFTPDGRLVLVSTLRGPDVVVFDAATHAVVKRVIVGTGAAGIQMQPDGARAYVACTPDNYVAVIDLKTLTVLGHIDAGPQPDGLAWAVRP